VVWKAETILSSECRGQNQRPVAQRSGPSDEADREWKRSSAAPVRAVDGDPSGFDDYDGVGSPELEESDLAELARAVATSTHGSHKLPVKIKNNQLRSIV
jgi:hypothetical protein